MEYRKKIWAAGSAREILRVSRARFAEGIKLDPLGAFVIRASDFYSLAGRYAAGWRKLLGLYYFVRAIGYAKEAAKIAEYTVQGLSPDQADVVSRIFSRTPRSCRCRELASSILDRLFESGQLSTALPHTQALIWCTLGEIHWQERRRVAAYADFLVAERLIPLIEVENSEDREFQLIRVSKAVGFFYLDHGSDPQRVRGRKLVFEALNLATRISEDQRNKIIRELRSRKLIG